MEYVIAVFSVRTETLMYNNYLQRLGISSTIINTPKEAHTSCGICVRCPIFALETIKKTNFKSYNSFVGLFKYKKSMYGVLVTPIKI